MLFMNVYAVHVFCYSISMDKLTYLSKHFQTNGLTLPQRRSGGRQSNKRVLSFDDTGRAIRFIKNFAQDHALSLPGRVSGFKRDDISLLPSAYPKSRIYRLYKVHAENAGEAGFQDFI